MRETVMTFMIRGVSTVMTVGLVMEWASRHQEELMVDWELAHQQAALRKIDPLE